MIQNHPLSMRDISGLVRIEGFSGRECARPKMMRALLNVAERQSIESAAVTPELRGRSERGEVQVLKPTGAIVREPIIISHSTACETHLFERRRDNSSPVIKCFRAVIA